MVIFDLEWNSGCYDKIRLDEILHIGAVKLDRASGRIVDTFCAYIHPRVHKRYSPPVQQLPSLPEYEHSQLNFPAAAELFFQWCGSDLEFGTWGGADFGALRQNVAYWKLDLPMPQSFYDLQAAFSYSLGADTQIALQRAVEYCQIPESFEFHNALHDAAYAALVSAPLSSALLAQARRTPALACPSKKQRKSSLGLPARGRPWCGPYPSPEAALNSHGCRRAVCPVCQKTRSFISHWRALPDRTVYSGKFTCPLHGSYLLQLELARDRQARTWGITQAIPLTAASKPLLRQFKQGGTVLCTRKSQARRRTRRA